MNAWTVATLAQGMAVTLSTQLSKNETVGFECSAKGMSVLAQVATEVKTSSVNQIELSIGGAKIVLKTIYMLDANPPYWAADVGNFQTALDLIGSADSIEVSVPGRKVMLSLEMAKTKEFLNACSKLAGKK